MAVNTPAKRYHNSSNIPIVLTDQCQGENEHIRTALFSKLIDPRYFLNISISFFFKRERVHSTIHHMPLNQLADWLIHWLIVWQHCFSLHSLPCHIPSYSLPACLPPFIKQPVWPLLSPISINWEAAFLCMPCFLPHLSFCRPFFLLASPAMVCE